MNFQKYVLASVGVLLLVPLSQSSAEAQAYSSPRELLETINNRYSKGELGDAAENAEDIYGCDPKGKDPNTGQCYAAVGQAAILLSHKFEKEGNIEGALQLARLSAFCLKMARQVDTIRNGTNTRTHREAYVLFWDMFKPPAGSRDPAIDEGQDSN